MTADRYSQSANELHTTTDIAYYLMMLVASGRWIKTNDRQKLMNWHPVYWLIWTRTPAFKQLSFMLCAALTAAQRHSCSSRPWTMNSSLCYSVFRVFIWWFVGQWVFHRPPTSFELAYECKYVLAARLQHSQAAYGVVRCLSVCLSVCRGVRLSFRHVR